MSETEIMVLCPSLHSHSPTYLPDFVLHGTSEPGRSFQPKLERHLASMVKVMTAINTVVPSGGTLWNGCLLTTQFCVLLAPEIRTLY